MKNQFRLGTEPLWFVTRPNPTSEIEDIVFKIGTWRDLSYHFNGGLDPDDIVGTFKDEKAARDLGAHLLTIAAGGHR